MRPAVPAFLSLFLALSSALSAQVVARQGDPAESPLQEFKSPMVLELPLKDFQALADETGKDFKEVRKFYCEDLAISQLVVSKKEDSRRGKSPEVRLDIRGSVWVRPSYDRLATIRFDVVNGDERFATTQVFQINAEEGKTRPFSATLRFDAGEFERLFTAGDSPLLRVTVTVEDNS